VASVGSGILVSRWGRYKVFPVVGTALTTIGLFLMAHIGVSTGAWTMAGYMAIFGLGLGLVMSVLLVAVQNAVPYEELGTATSGSYFFRMIGGSFGTAVFGTIFASLILNNILRGLHLASVPAGFSVNAEDPASIHRLPAAIQAGVIAGIAHTVQTVFLIGVPIAFVAFLLSWTLPEIELRKSIRTTEPAEGLGPPEPLTSLGEVQRILERAASRENRRELYETLAARADIDLDPRAVWMLYRMADRPDCTLDEVGARLKVEPERLEDGIDSLVSAGMLERSDGTERCSLSLTDSGRDAIERLTAARRASMTDLLAGWDPEAHPEILDMVRHLATELLADDNKLLADARAAGV
jgi:DNA-binding MarR family transcriptional regulator